MKNSNACDVCGGEIGCSPECARMHILANPVPDGTGVRQRIAGAHNLLQVAHANLYIDTFGDEYQDLMMSFSDNLMSAIGHLQELMKDYNDILTTAHEQNERN